MSGKRRSKEDIQMYLDTMNNDEDSSAAPFEESGLDGIVHNHGDLNPLLDIVNDPKTVGENYLTDAQDNCYYQDVVEQNANIVEERTVENSVLIKRETEEKPIIIVSDVTVSEGRSQRIKKKPAKLADGISQQFEDTEVVYEFNEAETTETAQTDVNIIHPVVIIKSDFQKDNKTSNDFKCPSCPFVAPKKYLLSRHVKTHSEDKPFKCPICNRKFKSNFILQSHVNIHLGKKPYVCKVCEKAFTTNGELTRHTRYKHTGEKPHKCTECDYATVEMSKLRRHMRSHTGERPYQCPHCTYASPDTFKLKRHIRTHTGEKPYECEICQARFTQSNSLKSHRLIHNVGEKPVFKCSYCPTTCGRKRDLYTHVLILHNTDKPIICKRCGKELPDRYNYKLHVRTHQGEKCYRCRYCPYASVLEKNVESHMLIHTDEKPFVCDICNHRFRQNQLLKRHVNLYHNKNYVKPEPKAKEHSCPKCKRSYTHKGNLMRHMETHDPDSKIQEEKQKLLLGRKTKVKPDGTISAPLQLLSEYGTLPEDNSYESYTDHNSIEYEETTDDPDSQYDKTEFLNTSGELDDIDDDEDQEKPFTIEIEDLDVDESDDNVSITANVKVKKENGINDDCLAVQDEDGTKYIIYTVEDETENEDDGNDNENEGLEESKKQTFLQKNKKKISPKISSTKISNSCIRLEDNHSKDYDYENLELPEIVEIIETEE